MKVILEKTYESMNILMKKFNENDNNITSISKTPKNKYCDFNASLGIDIIDIKSNHKLIEDNMKLKDILK
jgi:hypothetical protein